MVHVDIYVTEAIIFLQIFNGDVLKLNIMKILEIEKRKLRHFHCMNLLIDIQI